MSALLDIKGVGKRFGGFTALEGIDLTVNAGERVGLIGPNVSGKSTLVNCISGTLHNDSGSVHFEAAVGEGIAEARFRSGDWHFAARAGGETLRLADGRPARTLKNLLQEGEVPLWQREKLPLLFHDGRLVWVPGVGIAAEYACGSAETGLVPSWRVAGKAPLC